MVVRPVRSGLLINFEDGYRRVGIDNRQKDRVPSTIRSECVFSTWWSRGLRRLGLGTAVILVGVLLALVSKTAAFGMARGTTFAPCTISNGGWHLVATGQGSQIPQVGLSGFDPSSCDGLTAIVTMTGNAAGDQAAPADLTLATWNSADDPCTGTALTTPNVVRNGSISLAGCAGGGPARTPLIKQVTEFTVSVGGTTQVLGETFTKQPGTSSPSPSSATHGLLPFTGSWSEYLTDVGILLVLVGFMLWLIGYVRRRRQAGTEPTA